MPTPAENVATAIANYTAILVDVSVNPKPSYSLDGESYSWTEYQNFLADKIAELRKTEIMLRGPYSKNTRGRG